MSAGDLPTLATAHPPVPDDHAHRWLHYIDGSGNSVCACGAQQDPREQETP